MKFSILSLLAALAAGVFAEHGAPYSSSPQGEINFYACRTQVVGSATFCKPMGRAGGRGAAYGCPCKNKNAMATMAGCFEVNHRNTTDTIKHFLKACEEDYNTTVTQSDWDAAVEFYRLDAIPIAEALKYNESGIITKLLILDLKMTKLYAEAYDVFMGNYNDSLYYAIGIIAYWMLVLLGFALNNWAKFFFPSVFVRTKGNKYVNKFKKHVAVPAAFGKEKQNLLQARGRLGKFFQILMPSRIESLLMVGFLFVCIAFMGSQIRFVENDPIFYTKSRAIGRYLAVRTGIIATLNIPMLILFAGRNNFLQWLTGVNFATFIMIHKWISRMFIVMLIIHSVCYSYLFGSTYLLRMKAEYLVFGVIGTVSGSLLFLQSMVILRRRWYEVFLIGHIVLAALFVVGAWKHVDELGYVWFIYLATAIWVFDRVVRLGRLIWFGFPKVDLQLINNDTIKVKIPTTKRWRPTNGGFAYVYFMHRLRFFQSHPFSYLQMPDSISFFIKVKEGVTKDFHRELATCPGQSMKMRVTIEGPYGGGLESCNVRHYHSAVFLAGGNGIPGMFSEAMHLGSRPDMKQRVKLIWIIRDYNYVNLFFEELSALKDTRVECEIHVTRPEHKCIGFITELDDNSSDNSSLEKTQDRQTQIDVSDSDKEKESGSEVSSVVSKVKRNLNHIVFHHGRPLMDTLVASEIEECPGNSIAFVTCGHPQMVDEVRLEVARNSDGDKRVDFYEHLQVWA